MFVIEKHKAGDIVNSEARLNKSMTIKVSSRSKESDAQHERYKKINALLSLGTSKKKKESRFYVIFPVIHRLRCAVSMYVYYYTLAFEPDFAVEKRKQKLVKVCQALTMPCC